MGQRAFGWSVPVALCSGLLAAACVCVRVCFNMVSHRHRDSLVAWPRWELSTFVLLLLVVLFLSPGFPQAAACSVPPKHSKKTAPVQKSQRSENVAFMCIIYCDHYSSLVVGKRRLSVANTCRSMRSSGFIGTLGFVYTLAAH